MIYNPLRPKFGPRPISVGLVQVLLLLLEVLQNELRNVGLHLNPSKTKSFTSKKNLQPMFLDIAGNFVEVMTNNETHKYLGRKLCAQSSVRSAVQLSFRVQCAWMQFH